MRKSIKICLAVGIFCIIAGSGIAIAAASMGASATNVKMPIVNFMEDVDKIIDVDEIEDGTYSSYSGAEGVTADETLQFADINKLKIDGGEGVIRITSSETVQAVTVSYWQQDGRVKIKQNGTEIKIESDRKRKKYGWNTSTDSQKSPVVLINIPRGYQFDEVDLDLGATQCEIESLNTDKLDIDAGAGMVDIWDSNVGEFDLDGSVGEVNYQGTCYRDVKIDCGVGSVNLNLTGKETDFNYDIEGGIGEITVGNESFSGMVISKKIDNSASKKMSLDCTVGSIEVLFEE